MFSFRIESFSGHNQWIKNLWKILVDLFLNLIREIKIMVTLEYSLFTSHRLFFIFQKNLKIQLSSNFGKISPSFLVSIKTIFLAWSEAMQSITHLESFMKASLPYPHLGIERHLCSGAGKIGLKTQFLSGDSVELGA